MVLGGGEPLLAPHTPELLRRIKSQGMAGMLTTNATLLSPAVRALLVEIGWDEVHISLDGATPATHDRMRGRAGAFRRSVAATCRLRSLRDQRGQGLPKIVIHTVLTRFNVAELSGLVRLAAAVGAESVELDALVVYQEEQAEFALSPADDAALPARIEAALTVAKQVGVATNFQRFLSPESRDRGNRRPEAGPGAGLGRAPCLKPWHHLVVAANGHLSPCCVLAGEGESVADTSLAAVWEGSPYLQNLRTQMLTGVPAGRCAECSENILVHERNIRAALAPSAP
jgi:MoaA/NifB/PqqE/SkfB family radical SAM enzyme